MNAQNSKFWPILTLKTHKFGLIRTVLTWKTKNLHFDKLKLQKTPKCQTNLELFTQILTFFNLKQEHFDLYNEKSTFLQI